MNVTYTRTELMTKALEELKKCPGYPKVGVVIAKQGKILATGFREEIAGLHAERVAITKIKTAELAGATIFTTLEPCVRLHDNQLELPCANYLTGRGVLEVVIGVLDPNGKIYCQGYKMLLTDGIKVTFFDPLLRELIEKNTFKNGDLTRGYGPNGTRRVGVVNTAGKKFTIHRSRTDLSSLEFRWALLQFEHGIVDLLSVNDNNAVREATGASDFKDISDPLVFRETSHAARMKVGQIAVIYPENSKFAVLVMLKELTEYDITFKWQVRDVGFKSDAQHTKL